MQHPAPDRLELVNGNQRCVFVRTTATGWKPDWFYLGGERHLRFKDHEWMSVGNERALLLDLVEDTPGRKTFRGSVTYYGTSIPCEVSVSLPESCPGFEVRSSLTPPIDVELQEALSSFETPYVHDGEESVLCAIGMEPILVTSKGKKLAGIEWENPLWFYNRPGVARMTSETFAPYLAHQITTAAGRNRVTLLLDGVESTFADLYATPTRRVIGDGDETYDPATEFSKGEGRNGYKFIVGAFNWSSTLKKDPNLLVEGGQTIRQCLLIDFTGDDDKRTPDAWLQDAWGRLLLRSMPSDGLITAQKIARDQGVTWQTASEELIKVLRQEEIPGLWSSERGIAVYIDGTRPKAGGLNQGFSMLWLAPAAYLAHWRGDTALTDRTRTLGEKFAASVANADPAEAFTLGTCFFVAVPAMRLLALRPDLMPDLGKAATHYLDGMLAAHRDGAKPEGLGDYGVRTIAAHALLLGGRALGDKRYSDHALTMLDFINAQLDERFWFFGGGFGEKCPAGHQARTLGYAHAIYSNLEAHRFTGNASYLAAARRFANFLSALFYSTINQSPVPDFDTRGWAHGALSGRDQIAEFPPFETCDGVRSIAALAQYMELPDSMYDLIWLTSRTTLAMMPAARTHKRIHDTQGRVVYRPLNDFANERAIYGRFPFVSYENPWDQTLQATYQGAEPIPNRLTFGGEIGQADDDRILVFSPHAAAWNVNHDGSFPMLCWNPLKVPVRTTLRLRARPGAGAVSQEIELAPRSPVRVTV
jgi:hypothetical protein